MKRKNIKIFLIAVGNSPNEWQKCLHTVASDLWHLYKKCKEEHLINICTQILVDIIHKGKWRS